MLMRLLRCLFDCLLLVNIMGMAVAGTMAFFVVTGIMALLVGMLPLILLVLFNDILARLGGGGGGGKRFAVGDKAAASLRLGQDSLLLGLTTAGLIGCEFDLALPLFSTDIPRALVLADLCNTDDIDS